MGEAKRRKKLDSNYGQIPLLTSQNQKEKHVNLVINSLSTQFETELKKIASAESIIEEYDRIKHQISLWLYETLQPYSEGDCTLIASSIMSYYAKIVQEYETSPLLLKLIFEVLEPFLSEEKRIKIGNVVKKIDRELSA